MITENDKELDEFEVINLCGLMCNCKLAANVSVQETHTCNEQSALGIVASNSEDVTKMPCGLKCNCKPAASLPVQESKKSNEQSNLAAAMNNNSKTAAINPHFEADTPNNINKQYEHSILSKSNEDLSKIPCGLMCTCNRSEEVHIIEDLALENLDTVNKFNLLQIAIDETTEVKNSNIELNTSEYPKSLEVGTNPNPNATKTVPSPLQESSDSSSTSTVTNNHTSTTDDIFVSAEEYITLLAIGPYLTPPLETDSYREGIKKQYEEYLMLKKIYGQTDNGVNKECIPTNKEKKSDMTSPCLLHMPDAVRESSAGIKPWHLQAAEQPLSHIEVDHMIYHQGNGKAAGNDDDPGVLEVTEERKK